MVAADFLHDSQVRQWLDGVEPAWTLLTFDSLRALRQEPSAAQTAIQIASDLNADEIAGSAVARNLGLQTRRSNQRMVESFWTDRERLQLSVATRLRPRPKNKKPPKRVAFFMFVISVR